MKSSIMTRAMRTASNARAGWRQRERGLAFTMISVGLRSYISALPEATSRFSRHRAKNTPVKLPAASPKKMTNPLSDNPLTAEKKPPIFQPGANIAPIPISTPPKNPSTSRILRCGILKRKLLAIMIAMKAPKKIPKS